MPLVEEHSELKKRRRFTWAQFSRSHGRWEVVALFGAALALLGMSLSCRVPRGELTGGEISLRKALDGATEVRIYVRPMEGPRAMRWPGQPSVVLSENSEPALWRQLKRSPTFQAGQEKSIGDARLVFLRNGTRTWAAYYALHSDRFGVGLDWAKIPEELRARLEEIAKCEEAAATPAAPPRSNRRGGKP
jgi:hypothetical protein